MKSESVRGFFGTVPVNNPADLARFSEVRSMLTKVKPLVEKMTRVNSVQAKPGTEWEQDKKHTQSLTTESVVLHALHQAADALNALEVLLGEQATIPYVVHHSVARSGLEASSLAVWLLASDDPRERIHRYLREIWREVSEESKIHQRAIEQIVAGHFPELKIATSIDQERKRFRQRKRHYLAHIRKIAIRFGLPDPSSSVSTVSFREITGEAASSIGFVAETGQNVWSELSSLSHPSMVRSMRSNIEIQQPSSQADTVEAIISTSAVTALLAVSANITTFEGAVELTRRRKLQLVDQSTYGPPT